MASRPAYNTGVGFFTLDGKLYDANGNEFICRGINCNHWDEWWTASAGMAQTAVTKANVLRFFQPMNPAEYMCDDASLRSKLDLMIANKMIPMPAVNWTGSADLTGSQVAATLTTAVDQWISRYALLKPYEKWMLLNIANEWGPETTVWRTRYIAEIARLRAAGFLNTLIVDCGGWGNSAASITSYAQAVYDADPQHNIVFSYHVYDTDAATFATNAAAFKATGLPIVFGEFGPGTLTNPSNPLNGSYLTPADVIATANTQGLGWMGWAWDDDYSTTWFSMLRQPSFTSTGGVPNGGAYPNNTQLTIFGNDVILSPHGTRATAVEASIFGASSPASFTGGSSSTCAAAAVVRPGASVRGASSGVGAAQVEITPRDIVVTYPTTRNPAEAGTSWQAEIRQSGTYTISDGTDTIVLDVPPLSETGTHTLRTRSFARGAASVAVAITVTVVTAMTGLASSPSSAAAKVSPGITRSGLSSTVATARATARSGTLPTGQSDTASGAGVGITALGSAIRVTGASTSLTTAAASIQAGASPTGASASRGAAAVDITAVAVVGHTLRAVAFANGEASAPDTASVQLEVSQVSVTGASASRGTALATVRAGLGAHVQSESSSTAGAELTPRVPLFAYVTGESRSVSAGDVRVLPGVAVTGRSDSVGAAGLGPGLPLPPENANPNVTVEWQDVSSRASMRSVGSVAEVKSVGSRAIVHVYIPSQQEIDSWPT